MPPKKPPVYPYIPNSTPAAKEAMLREVGPRNVDEFYDDIPESLRLKRKMKLPEPLLSEAELIRHVDGLMNKNRSTR